jgi:hypothetical protein
MCLLSRIASLETMNLVGRKLRKVKMRPEKCQDYATTVGPNLAGIKDEEISTGDLSTGNSPRC